jgi:hypothetical protein
MNRNIPATTIAALSLLVALGSGSYAAGVLTGKDIKNSSLTGKDLKNESVTGKDVTNLTGDDIDEDTLETVTSARDSSNAFRLEGLGPDDLLQVDSCQLGKVRGFARVKGNNPAMPNTFTTEGTFIDAYVNCAPAAVSVRRKAVGQYQVRFRDNPGTLAFVQVHLDGAHLDQNLCSTASYTYTPGYDQGSFEVRLVNCDDNTPADADFGVMLP